MARFKEADARIFHGVFVCKKCKSKIRTSLFKVRDRKTKCRKCGSKALRPKKKDFKKV